MSTEYAECIACRKSTLPGMGRDKLGKTPPFQGVLQIARCNPFRILPTITMQNDASFELYLSAAQAMIEKMIPESYWLELSDLSPEYIAHCNHKTVQDPPFQEEVLQTIRTAFFRFSRQVPLLEYHTFSDGLGGIVINLICHSEFASGAGRYCSDLFSSWLVPGKRLMTDGGLSIDFCFALNPEKRYFFLQKFFRFTDVSDLSSALRNVPRLIEEVRLNILAVIHARTIASMKSLTPEQRNLIIQENISSLFHATQAGPNRNVYDQMHQFLLKLSEEEKLGQIKKNIAHLMQSRPQDFDRDMFHEMTSFTAYFSEHFTTIRDARHVSRVIAFHYLFKKTLLLVTKNAPDERHLSFKLIKVQLAGADPVVGILVGMNLLREAERFDKKHLLRAVQSCLPEVTTVANSFIADRREDKIRLFYLEIQKPNQQLFTSHEIRLLQQELPQLLKNQVENVIHPIFMPRNEEEVLRNIVHLSKQIKFLRDLPHLTIHYEKQTDSEISFLVVLVRLLRENELPFKELIKNGKGTIRIVIDEIRSAGSLKRRYPKEAVIFRCIIDKSSFFRKDYTLDLKRARQHVGTELRQLLGEFRDYNGGMIHKQNEALEQLRKVIGPAAAEHEILLENFFYSLRPGIMQTVHSPEILQIFFELLLKALQDHLVQNAFSLQVASEGKYFFALIAAAAPTFKDDIQTAVSKLKIASYDVTTTFLHVQEFASMGYILRTDEIEKRSQFQQTLLDVMLKWKSNFSCALPPSI